MSKTRIFVVQAVENRRELTPEEQEQFALACDRAKSVYPDAVFISQPDIDEEPWSNTEPDIWWLGKAITAISRADIIWFCKGYRQSKTCQILSDIAEQFDTLTVEAKI